MKLILKKDNLNLEIKNKLIIEKNNKNNIENNHFVEYLQLSLEEAFFLQHALNCLIIETEKVNLKIFIFFF